MNGLTFLFLLGSNNNGVDMGYNVQTTVDAKHKLVVDFKVTTHANDIGELDNMALRAKKLFGGQPFNVLADKGYYKAEDLKRCVRKGLTPYVSRLVYSNVPEIKTFTRTNFIMTKKTMSIDAPLEKSFAMLEIGELRQQA